MPEIELITTLPEIKELIHSKQKSIYYPSKTKISKNFNRIKHFSNRQLYLILKIPFNREFETMKEKI